MVLSKCHSSKPGNFFYARNGCRVLRRTEVACGTVSPFCCARKSFKKVMSTPQGNEPGKPCSTTARLERVRHSAPALRSEMRSLYEKVSLAYASCAHTLAKLNGITRRQKRFCIPRQLAR